MNRRKSRNGSARATLADIAQESGFSISTVSIVLNEAPLSRYVAAKTKEHIRKVAKQVGYRPDAFARSLRKRHSETIGVMVFDLSDPYCTLILQGVQRVLRPTEYLPFVMDAHNQYEQFERYITLLLEYRVEGLIVIANWLFIDIALLKELERYRIPTVLVGVEMKSSFINSVLVDNELGGYLALEHLYSLGHRKLAFIKGPPRLWDSGQRWEGAQRFAQEKGLTLKDEWVVELSGSTDATSGFHEGFLKTQELLSRHPGFTALAAFDDLTSFGAVRALRMAERRVPEDCSVIGFDDIPSAAFFNPGLTTIHQPLEEMGQMAAQRVLEDLGTPPDAEWRKSQISRLPPTVVVRESTRRRRVT